MGAKIGDRFNRLTVIEILDVRKKERYVRVKCDCGNEKDVAYRNVRTGKQQSCGCLRKENLSKIGKQNKKHGMDGTKIYKLWATMKGRCSTPTITGYERYGGRGIKVCDEWQKFEPFYKWAIENGYEEGLSIDRIDADGDYEPSNCQWLTLADNTRKMHEDKRKREEKCQKQ